MYLSGTVTCINSHLHEKTFLCSFWFYLEKHKDVCSVLITDGNKLGSITENLKQNQEPTTVLLF